MSNDLENRVQEHDRTLAGLKLSIQGILVGVEELTQEAREALSEYQQHKRAGNVALGLASERFRGAMRVLTRIADMQDQLVNTKREHVALSNEVIRLAATDPKKAERLIPQVKASRKRLHDLHAQIEQCRREARLSTDDEDTREVSADTHSKEGREP